MSHSNRNQAAKKQAKATQLATLHDHDYSGLLESVRTSFEENSVGHTLFQTSETGDLFEIYLNSFETEKQTHNCNACKAFLRRFGGLVTVDIDGTLVPVMWSETKNIPDFYLYTFQSLADCVRRAKIVSPFYSSDRIWGTPVTGTWSHMAIVPSETQVYKERSLTASQAMAAMRERYKTVATALADFKPEALDELLRIFHADVLSRSEKFIAPVQWLRDLHNRPKGKPGTNLLWQAISVAPEGYCHPRASIIAPLLDSILAGRSFTELQAQFNSMLHPLRYQRPQAAPTAGNIKAAEELIAKLGIERSLARRFATLEECKTIWRPTKPEQHNPAPQGIFAHLKPKNSTIVPRVELPITTMTWEKFTKRALPSAKSLELYVPPIGNFTAILTAAHADAPNILKWNNPFSWYLYHNGSTAFNWNLTVHTWTPITGIVPKPNLWETETESPYLFDGLILVLSGATDQNEAGNGLFPEILRNDLFSVRSTIEAYSRSAKISNRENATACGIGISKGACRVKLRINNENIVAIDRWD